jgi:type VI secretion system ImpC/EvpB family protein
MLDGRRALVDLRDRKISREQFLEKLKVSPLPMFTPEAVTQALRSASESRIKQAPRPPKPAPMPKSDDEDTLDAILDMVESPANVRQAPVETTEGAARVQQFISDMFEGKGTRDPVDRRALNDLLTECDKELSDRLNEVLCAEEFCRLETSWRSLKFLVDHTDFRKPIQLDVIPAKKEQLPEIMKFLLEERDEAEVPSAVVIAGFEFANSPSEMANLKEAAELAEQLQAPLLVNVGAAFFGKANALEVARIPLLQSHLESAEFVKWNSLRQSEASRWVGVCFNRFLLRGPYDESSGNRLPFRFKGQRDGLRGESSWIIGSLIMRSFAQSGWCGHITGIRAGGAIEDLPVQNRRMPSGGETQIPLETIFLKDREDDFFTAGFMILQSGENQDKAVLLHAPSAHLPEIYSDMLETETSRRRAMITYPLVAAQFVRYLEPMLQKLERLGSPSEIERGLEQGFHALVAKSAAANALGVQVNVKASENRPGLHELWIRLQPGPSIWSLQVDLELRIPVKLGG